MATVFISYRRDDSAGITGRIYDRLVAALGETRVFRDLEAIAPGVDFTEAIDAALERSDVVLAVIGPEWLTVSDEDGRRIDDPDDVLRREIAGALERSDVVVVPVLVNEATMPRAEDLPTDLTALSKRNAFPIRDGRFKDDMRFLMKSLGLLRWRRSRIVAGVAVAGVLLLAGVALAGIRMTSGGENEAEPTTRPPATTAAETPATTSSSVLTTTTTGPLADALMLSNVTFREGDVLDVVLQNRSESRRFVPTATYRVLEVLPLREPVNVVLCFTSGPVEVQRASDIVLPIEPAPLPPSATVDLYLAADPGDFLRFTLDFAGASPPSCTGRALLYLVEIAVQPSTSDRAAGAQPVTIGPIALSPREWRPDANYFSACTPLDPPTDSDFCRADAHLTNADALLTVLEEASIHQPGIEALRVDAEAAIAGGS